jgi:hypothetical protein
MLLGLLDADRLVKQRRRLAVQAGAAQRLAYAVCIKELSQAVKMMVICDSYTEH